MRAACYSNTNDLVYRAVLRGCHKTTFKILFLILCYGIKNSEYYKHLDLSVY